MSYIRCCKYVTCLLILKAWPLTQTWVASLLQIGCFPPRPACQMSYSISGKYDYNFSFILFSLIHCGAFRSVFLKVNIWCWNWLITCLIRKYDWKPKIERMTWWKCCCDVSRSSETTQACKQGRSTTVRLRCNPTVTAKDLITPPRYLSLGPSSTFDLTRVVHSNISFDTLLCYNRSKMSHKLRLHQAVWFNLVQFTFFGVSIDKSCLNT